MKYILIICLVFFMASDTVDTVESSKTIQQAEDINSSLDSLTLKLDSLIQILKNDTIK